MPRASTSPTWERFYPTRVIGRHVEAFGEVDSTMDVAWSRAERGAPHGIVVRADTQRMGRGRFARRWESGPGDSLLISTLLRTPPVPLGAPIAVAATLAVRDAAQELAEVTGTVKWPNDVLLHGLKIAGVLVEVHATTAGEATAVLGIGLNVNLDPQEHPAIADLATSLAHEAGRTFQLDEVEASLLAHLDHRGDTMLTDPSRLMGEWRSALETLGQKVAVHQRDSVLVGVAEDVDADGRLLLRTGDGALHSLAEGDVSLQS